MKYFYVAALLAILFLQSCKKNNTVSSQLPEITSEGKNTFGCYVDNSIWLPSNSVQLHATQLCAHYDNLSHSFTLQCWRDNPATGNKAADLLELKINNITDAGSFDLTDPNSGSASVAVSPNLYGPSTVLAGAVIVKKFSTLQNIISGEFSFTTRSNDKSITYKVTEGRFDLKLDYCK